MGVFLRVLLHCTIIGIGALSNGLITVYYSPAKPSLDLDLGLTSTQGSAFNAIGLFFAAIGALITKPVVMFFGRRWSLVVTAILTCVGWIMLAPARAMWLAMLSRAILGVALGLNATVCPIYLTESSPLEYRGTFGCFYQLLLSVGFVICYLVGIFAKWRVLAWVMLVAPVLLVVLIWFVPDSPVEEGVLAEEPLFASRHLRRLPHVLALVFAQQLSGINAILTNLGEIFEGAKVSLKAAEAACVASIAGVPGCVLAAWMVERFGRRPTWIAGSATAGAAHLLLWVAGLAKLPGGVPIFSVFLYFFAFGFSLGPIVWVLVPELYVDAVRSFWLSAAVLLNWLLAGAMSYAWPSVQEAIGVAWGFFVFAVACLLAVVYGVFLMPETKGEQMGGQVGQAVYGQMEEEAMEGKGRHDEDEGDGDDEEKGECTAKGVAVKP